MGGLSFLSGYADVMTSPESNASLAEFVREKIREIVHDPEVAGLLSPTQQIGCKRMCVDTGYYETFNRDNVTLVDISERGIDEITPTGVRVGDRVMEADVIVFATGFDAMTGALLKIDVRGREGLSLREKWAAGPRTYLGLQVAGFPNLFTISGPGSPSVLTNMIVSIQQHVEFIRDCLVYMAEHGKRTIEAAASAEDEWVGVVNAIADETLFPTCNSWYLGANVPGKPRVFMPFIGFPPYAAKCEEVAAKGYEGFLLG
jgi:cyclohexanone monooxygenase